jgi:hypothetical protein
LAETLLVSRTLTLQVRSAQQLAWCNTQGVREAMNVEKGDILQTTFNLADICHVHIAEIGELLLRQFACVSKSPHSNAELPLNVLLAG